MRCQVPGARCQVPGVKCQVSGVRCSVSGARCQVSGARCQVSSVRCQVPGVRCQVPDARCEVLAGTMLARKVLELTNRLCSALVTMRCMPSWLIRVKALSPLASNLEWHCPSYAQSQVVLLKQSGAPLSILSGHGNRYLAFVTGVAITEHQ